MQSGSHGTLPIASPLLGFRQEVFDALGLITNCSSGNPSAVAGGGGKGDGSRNGNVTTGTGTGAGTGMGTDENDDLNLDLAAWECIKALSTEELLKAQEALVSIPEFEVYPFVPVIDGDIIPSDPAELVRGGKFAKLPFISGNNKDEGTYFPPLTLNSPASSLAFIDVLLESRVNLSTFSTIQSFYPTPADGSPFDTGNNTFGLDPAFKQTAAIVTDASFMSPRRLFLDSAEHYGLGDKSWTYLFSQNDNSSSYLGVTHSSEIKYVFGAPPVNSSQPLSEQMIAYWINFITYTNPNGDPSSPLAAQTAQALNLTNWPTRADNGGLTMLNLQLGNLTLIKDDFRNESIAYLNTIGATLEH